MIDQSDLELTEAVERVAIGAGASLVGSANMEGLADLPRAVALAVRYAPDVFAEAEHMPNPAFEQEHTRLRAQMERMAQEVAAHLRTEGYDGDCDLAAAPSGFSHKMTATRAGLGWVGKCDLFVSRELGPAVRLGTVLTDAPLAVGEPTTESECGGCTVCVDACPAGAASGRLWSVDVHRDEFFDVSACRAMGQERPLAFGMEGGGCAVCMAVCPRRPRK